MFNEYELTVIIRPDLDDAATAETIDNVEAVIQAGGGKLLDRDDWGKRKLAYAIDRHLKGHYVLIDFASGPELVAELERRMRNSDAIIRFLTVRIGEQIDLEARQQEAAERQKKRAEEAAQRAAERAAAEAAAAVDTRAASERAPSGSAGL